MFEHHTQPPLPRRAFVRRLLRHGGYAAVLVAASLVLGMSGYRWIVGTSWPDAFLETSMLLGGMGPVGALDTVPAKLFAGAFALYAGLVFLVVTALLLTPVVHRVLHRFHWDERADGRADDRPR